MSSARRRSTDAPGSSSAARGGGGGAGGPPGTTPGWRYTLRVPSWSQAQLPDGDTAVFYQVSQHALHLCYGSPSATGGSSRGGSQTRAPPRLPLGPLFIAG